ncbi:MAG: type I methionyl aminopeptidase [Christensenellaceae bacterium]|jgi:methionyl aminopeptidase|nr:type I methionyl aminopeptidase [Christensenellaceae bacterium]
MITIKNEAELNIMRKAGKVLADVLDMLSEKTKAGVSTKYLDTLAYEYIAKQNGVCSFYKYGGFPGHICISVNEEIVHGIPNASKIIKDGDLVKLDAGVGMGGFHTDAARTVQVGNVSLSAKRIAECAEGSFFEGLKAVKHGAFFSDWGIAVQEFAQKQGFSVVRCLCGHGIGREVHEDPQILNYYSRRTKGKMQSGMTLAFEPMLNAGVYEAKTLGNNWTVVTADGKLSAHYENTVIVTEGGAEIITVNK